jgi:hypothetical protein
MGLLWSESQFEPAAYLETEPGSGIAAVLVSPGIVDRIGSTGRLFMPQGGALYVRESGGRLHAFHVVEGNEPISFSATDCARIAEAASCAPVSEGTYELWRFAGTVLCLPLDRDDAWVDPADMPSRTGPAPHRPGPKAVISRLGGDVLLGLARLPEEITAAFCSGFDPQARDLCASLDRHELDVYNFLASCDRRLRNRRLEAVTRYPWLVNAALDGTANYWRGPLATAIDLHQPLGEVVTRLFHVRRSTAHTLLAEFPRGLGLGTPLASLGVLELPPYALAWALDAAPPERHPKSSCQWSAFVELVRGFGEDSLENKRAAIAGYFRVHGTSGWTEDLDRLKTRFGSVEVLRNTEELLDAIDTLSGVRHREAIYRYVRTERLLRLHRRWSREFERLLPAAVAQGKLPSVDFPVPLPEPRESGPWMFHPIRNLPELLAEGQAMQHCVATLYRACSRGERIAFSLRDRQSRRCCTFDVSVTPSPDGSARVRLNAMHGLRDRPPRPAERKAIESFVASLAERLAAVEPVWDLDVPDPADDDDDWTNDLDLADVSDEGTVVGQLRRKALERAMRTEPGFKSLVLRLARQQSIE